MTAPFEAKYRGVCASCEEPIRPGDLIRFEDDATVHDDCTDSQPPARPEKPPCSACWTVHAGECM